MPINDHDTEPILHIMGGTLVEHQIIDLPNYQLTLIVIEDPKYSLTDLQVCQIYDEGNHCLSCGSIFYENNSAHILWSNQGHI